MSLVEMLGLGPDWTPVFTMGLMCFILVLVHTYTPKLKLLRITGPQVPTFIIALLLTNFRILPPPDYHLYSFINNIFLPISLGLILLAIDIRAVAKSLGFRPFVLMFSGSIGVFLGGIISGLIFRPSPDFIKGIAIAAGNAMGGTENSLATAIALKTEEAFTGAMIAVIMIPYTMSAIINFGIAGSLPIRRKLDSWIKPLKTPEDVAKEVRDYESNVEYFEWGPIAIQGALAATLITVGISRLIGNHIPPIRLPGGGLITISWILVLTTVALIIGTYTRVKRIPQMRTIGMSLLWLAVMAIFAKTDLAKAATVLSIVPALVLMYLIHHVFIFLCAKFLRIDSLTAVTASMANIGGAASAPMVPVIGNIPELVPLSILMATIGYALANYLAWSQGQILLKIIHGVTI